MQASILSTTRCGPALAGVPPARPGAVARGRSGRVALRTVAAVKDVFMPALSSTMTEGKIVSWLKSPGDKVAKGESIVVVESGGWLFMLMGIAAGRALLNGLCWFMGFASSDQPLVGG